MRTSDRPTSRGWRGALWRMLKSGNACASLTRDAMRPHGAAAAGAHLAPKVREVRAAQHKTARLAAAAPMEARPVKLNVGGRLFFTEPETLAQGKKVHQVLRHQTECAQVGETNFFDGLLAPHATTRHVDGALWIDRDSALFEHILRWLRDRKYKRRTLLPENDLQLLRSEADFYLLSEMVEDIDERIAQRKASNTRTLVGALLVGAGAIGAAWFISHKQEQSSMSEQSGLGPDASKFAMPAVSGDDLAFCLLDELSLMKAQSLS